ncbi:NUMOD4 domain-containing protein [Ruminococcus sp.]|uniref:NUMOD4 domain-containing protein n=1 Tax=Ruminococcus sp. TaxID=41978 RepID=UPI001B3DECF1|nr:NUMOD4 domain-containing protein [Ruminococcus sp.]MBP5433747.1 hypothetical protein [Ruminococcus sp.]
MIEEMIEKLKTDFPDENWVEMARSVRCVYMLSETGKVYTVFKKRYKEKLPWSAQGMKFITYQDISGRSVNRSLSKLLESHFGNISEPAVQVYCRSGAGNLLNATKLLHTHYPDEDFAEIGRSKNFVYVLSDKGRVFSIRATGFKELTYTYRNSVPYVTVSIDGKNHRYSVIRLLEHYFGKKDSDSYPDEKWKTIDGFDKYEISNYGRVRSYQRGMAHILKGRSLVNRHPFVRLQNESGAKMCSINRLVAAAFIDRPEQKEYIYNKDGDYENNSTKNLKKVSRRQHASNMGRKSPHRRKAVRCIETGTVYSSFTEAAEALGLCVSHISLAVRWNATIDGKYTFKVVKEN